MPNYTNLKDLFTATADAIRSKTGSTDPIVADEFPAAIEGIQTGGSGGGGVVNDVEGVNFYDYDGTLLHSYTVEEAQALTELPPLPEQPGLICQGWNWSLEGIKNMNRAVNVGAMYITDDGKTRIYITLQDYYLSPVFHFYLNGRVLVDWGDGTSPDEVSATSRAVSTPIHKYAAPGDYIITLEAVDNTTLNIHTGGSSGRFITDGSGSYNIGASVIYQRSVRKIEIGNGIAEFTNHAFSGLSNLASITIPSNISTLSQNCFYECHSLKSVTLPIDCTQGPYYSFYGCYSLESVSIPESIKSIHMCAFYNCHSLKTVTMPNGTSMSSSSNFFGCYSLRSLTIPDSVTSIGQTAFHSCSALLSITLPDNVKSIGKEAFKGCKTLTSVVVPISVTSIGNGAFQECPMLASVTTLGNITSISDSLFQSCLNLSSINIPDSVISIGSSAFYNCPSLITMVMPNSIESIAASAFYNCRAMKFYDFSKHTRVPTLANANAFNYIPTDCEIRVPAALYDEWIAATNWATYASQIVAV